MKQISLILFAFFLLSSCTVLYRTVRYGKEDIDDHTIFPVYVMNENPKVFHFNTREGNVFDTIDIDWKYKNSHYHNLDSLLIHTSTRAFLIIQNDTVIYEKYGAGYHSHDISTLFSVSKSVTSLLVGVAIDEGYISDVNDPITKYISELNSANPMFQKLTIRHLLDMRSGLKFRESYAFNPFSKIARLYYGKHQLAKLKRLNFKYEPGTKYEYQSASTALLGIVIEKATQQTLARYFENKVWKPLEMQNKAKWSLDDTKHQSAKAYGGLSMCAIDLAKIGRLYLHGGTFNGRRIISRSWIEESLTPKVWNDGYQNQWYSFSGSGTDSSGNRYFADSVIAYNVWKNRYASKFKYFDVWQDFKSDYKRRHRKTYWPFEEDSHWRLSIYTGQFYALGIYGQVLFIDPTKNIILIRLGDNKEFDYKSFMYKISKAL